MGQCKRYASECKRNCSTVCACENSYRPSNGTEGMWFDDEFCSQCIHQAPLSDNLKQKNCDLVLAAMCFYPPEPEYPKEWIYQAGKPVCTKFVKWDWNSDGDPDDPDNPKAPPPPPDPNQLNLFPLYPNENHYETATKVLASV